MRQADFLNKNTLRNYPLRGDSSLVSDAGVKMPLAVFTGAQFSTTAEYPFLYISKVYVKDGYINVLVSSIVASVATPVGYFDGRIKEDYQTLKMTAIAPAAYGAIILGPMDTFTGFQGYHTYTSQATRVEDSLLTYVTPPGLTAISVGKDTLAGHLALEYVNVRRSTAIGLLGLEVINKDQVKAKNDVSAKFSNCGVPAIGDMNGVTPDEAGNIDIYGISPIELQVTAQGLRLTVPTITRAKLCVEEKRIPPLVQSSTYNRAIGAATQPEWKGWSQYR